jgi:glutamate racemase
MQNPAINELLEKYIGEYRGRAKAVVLGCTHYPFVERQIREILGDIDVYNGAEGVARELVRSLDEHDLRSSSSTADIIFESSDGRAETTDFYRRMLEL